MNNLSPIFIIHSIGGIRNESINQEDNQEDEEKV
jgi:hypothetical protein